MRKTGLIIAALALAGGIPLNARADTIISAPQTSDLAQWGVPDTATYGDAVTVPTNGDTQLYSFTYYLGPEVTGAGSGSIKYAAYVYAWNSNTRMASGSALYSSAVQTYTPGASFVPITFNPGVNLAAGSEYILFLSTSGLQGGQPDSAILWGTSNAAVSGLQGAFLNNDNTPAEWTTSTWVVPGGFKFATNVDFGPPLATPLPATLPLFASGLGALGLLGWRRKRKARVSLLGAA